MVSTLGELIFYITCLILCQIFRMHRKVMESFAKKYGFIFSKSAELNEKDSWLKIAKNDDPSGILNYTLYLLSKRRRPYRKFFNYMNGSYKERKLGIYNYQHNVWGYTVFEIETKKSLPVAIITAERSKLANLLDNENPPSLITATKMETESNEFNQDFKIFLEKDNDNKDELDILEILTPDVMAKLIDEEKKEEGKDIHLEFNKNKIILYKSIYILSASLKEQDLQRLLDLIIEIVEEIEN